MPAFSKLVKGLLLGAAAVYGMEVEGQTWDDAAVVEGEYIVVLHKHLATGRRAAHMDYLKSSFLMHVNATVKNEFDINEGEFQAYHLTGVNHAGQLQDILSMPEVRYVEPNWVSHIDQQCTRGPVVSPAGLWGIARTSHAARLPLPQPVSYEISSDACGERTDIFILDTGIRQTHTDFGGRATWVGGGDFTGEGQVDENGHGTHVASTAGGRAYGVARCSTLIAAKVCTRGGTCPADAQLRALELVAAAARASQTNGRKVVGNMSLGGLFRQASNDAVNAAVNAGAAMAVSAGNSNDDSCGRSPASAENAFTIMSSTNADARSAFSSFGRCCNVFAPGSAIEAAAITSDTATRTISGTSMAAPHAAGVLAKHWSKNRNLTPIALMRELEAVANRDLVTNPGALSPNRLLMHNCAT